MNCSEVILKERFNPSRVSIELSSEVFTGNCTATELSSSWKGIQASSSVDGNPPWDGTYYRLSNLEEFKLGSKKLVLSNIKYSTVRVLIEKNNRETLRFEQYPLHVNTGGLIRTSDGFYVFGKKLSNSKSGSDQTDIIGGGLQSSELEVNQGSDLAENMLKEMQEEINVNRAQISKLEIIGVILAKTTMSIVIIFEVLLNLSAEEVKILFESRRDFEMNELVYVDQSNLSDFLVSQGDYINVIQQLIG